MKRWRLSRSQTAAALFAVLFLILAVRLFELQIVRGGEYQKSFVLKTTKEIPVKAVRGNIYDRNGVLLAGNRLTYSVTFEETQEYESTRERQLSLNGAVYRLTALIEETGGSVENYLKLAVDENGDWQFTAGGSERERFLADIYGKQRTSELTEEEKEQSAAEVAEYLKGEERYAVFSCGGKPYTEEELRENGLPGEEELTGSGLLNILSIRYALSLTSYQKYLAVTVARGVPETVRAAVLESQAELPGAAVAEDSVRVYPQGEAFAPVLGYTGTISAEELAKRKDDGLTLNSAVGKTGIEQYLDEALQGTDGERKVCVDNTGRTVQDLGIAKEARQGEDVYLSIDAELQQSVYEALERKIAEVLCAHLIDAKEFDRSAVSDTTEIRTPVYDVYCALFTNGTIDAERFSGEEASELERDILGRFQEKKERVLEELSASLSGGGPVFSEQSREMQAYESFIAEKLGLIDEEGAGESGEFEESKSRWEEGSCSLSEYLKAAAGNGWLADGLLDTEASYLTADEAYRILQSRILELLSENGELKLLIYEQMVRSDEITPREACLLLYGQGVLSGEDEMREALEAGSLSPYDFIREKLTNLEITPAMLALEPCSGSAVVTEPDTGKVLACVSYPGYDNNRLANRMDTEYYYKLYNDRSLPMYNRATQQLLAPGSTFKPVTIAAGLSEGVIAADTEVVCDGVFDKVAPPLNCANRAGHGTVHGASEALVYSCNDYLGEVSYRMGLSEDGEFSDDRALKKLQECACLFFLDEKSGIELPESSPQVTDRYAIPSAIGQGTNSFSTVQLGRYAGTLANGGDSYELTLLESVGGRAQEPKYAGQVQLSGEIWESIRTGMEQYIGNTGIFEGFSMSVAGKSGTAQERKNEPDHGLFVGYAPAGDPAAAVAVRIVNGYDSGSAVSCGREILEACRENIIE